MFSQQLHRCLPAVTQDTEPSQQVWSVFQPRTLYSPKIKTVHAVGPPPSLRTFFQRLPVSRSFFATRPRGQVGQPTADLAPLAHLQSTAAPRPRKNPGGEEENQQPPGLHGDSTPRPRAKPAARSRLGRHHVNTACSAGRGGR